LSQNEGEINDGKHKHKKKHLKEVTLAGK